MIELLSPAGSADKLKTAIEYGANAVYMGGKSFSLRANSESPDDSEIADAVAYAHSKGVKVYMTLNILARDSDLKRLPAYLDILKKAQVDALIISDLGILSEVLEYWKDAEIHISTQASVLNSSACNFLYRQGVKRIVLARELSLSEIAEIRKNTPPDLELEAFVHGAMCVSHSGRCLLSDYLAGRSGNRGDCAQPCRWKYYLMEEQRPGEYLPVFEDQKGSYIFNSRDLCMIDHIPELIKAGVTSFKIEGRMKSEFYLGVVTRAYRTAIDSYLKDPENYRFDPALYKEVEKISHREYSTGFYFSSPGQIYGSSSYIRTTELLATVISADGNRALCTLKNKFSKGEKIDAVMPNGRVISFIAEKLFDEYGNERETVNTPRMKFYIETPSPLAAEALLRKDRE